MKRLTREGILKDNSHFDATKPLHVIGTGHFPEGTWEGERFSKWVDVTDGVWIASYLRVRSDNQLVDSYRHLRHDEWILGAN